MWLPGVHTFFVWNKGRTCSSCSRLAGDVRDGVGFKAVLNISDGPRIHSGQLHCRFNRELAREKLSREGLLKGEGNDVPLLRLNGLATVAAASRGQALADELRILVRRYRRDTEYALSIEEAIRICLVASASRADLNEWRDYVGDWLTELAFGDFQGNEGKAFYSHLQCLCHAVPELWVSCGKADAALTAFNAR